MKLIESIKRQIPNLITLGNLLCGTVAIGCANWGHLRIAALFVCLGIFLDFFDGLAARLLGVASPLGKELDSLADIVTSGIAPAYILFAIVGQLNGLFIHSRMLHIARLAVFMMPAFAAYRLAKFNLDTRQSHSFLGLPAPSNALIWVGVALTLTSAAFMAPACPPMLASPLLPYGLLLLSLATDVMMVSEVPMFSLKFNFRDLSWKTNRIQYIFLIGCAVIIAATRQWYAISLIILWYILLSLLTQRKHVVHD